MDVQSYHSVRIHTSGNDFDDGELGNEKGCSTNRMVLWKEITDTVWYEQSIAVSERFYIFLLNSDVTEENADSLESASDTEQPDVLVEMVSSLIST